MKKKNKYLDDKKVRENIKAYDNGKIIPEVFYEYESYNKKKTKKKNNMNNSIMLEILISILIHVFAYSINYHNLNILSYLYASDFINITTIYIIVKLLLHIVSIILIIDTIKSSKNKHILISYTIFLLYIPRTLFIIMNIIKNFV